MRFIDEVNIVIESGKGGDGCASFLREIVILLLAVQTGEMAVKAEM